MQAAGGKMQAARSQVEAGVTWLQLVAAFQLLQHESRLIGSARARDYPGYALLIFFSSASVTTMAICRIRQRHILLYIYILKNIYKHI